MKEKVRKSMLSVSLAVMIGTGIYLLGLFIQVIFQSNTSLSVLLFMMPLNYLIVFVTALYNFFVWYKKD
ncbi:hypothetical protein [Vagococcus silagei]|uniref:Uncharacterized protein n=1 Tax=Vagococcus silagei TaxID=2508885 RepID=A0A4S3B0M9_9ENTE|nr:hypothetical protein [Vagococcus silagei]THB60322.1 hypothetical protein ESZ54_11110 [Vagococcus silagei]